MQAASIARRQRRRQLREQVIAYLGGECAICRYNRCVEALDAHHLDDRTKDFTISSKLTSWNRIEPELQKCVLLCARCHREVHAGLHEGFLELDLAGHRGQYDLECICDEIDYCDPREVGLPCPRHER